MSDVSRILDAIHHGDARAADELLPLVYSELRRLAKSRLQQEKSGLTLQATDLVHEAYLRLVDVGHDQNFNGRGHFFAAAAEAMRRILVDQARRKLRVKHGGEFRKVDFDPDVAGGTGTVEETLAINEVLDKLAAESPAKAELVKLRYFAGMTVEEAAEILGVSRATAERHWTYARAFMLCELEQ